FCYDLPYKFEPFHLLYGDLVLCIGNKTYDAIVGDTTILANRFELVRFTQPFLSPYANDSSSENLRGQGFMFIKPFTIEMWIVIALLMIYTMFVVWFLEHQSNPEFRGPWKTQLNLLFSFLLP
ncbi:Glutamate receptor 3.1, partial [Camellia lanceoleosa]